MLLFAPASLTESTAHAQREGTDDDDDDDDDDDEIHFLRHRVFQRVAKSTQHEPKGVRKRQREGDGGGGIHLIYSS